MEKLGEISELEGKVQMIEEIIGVIQKKNASLSVQAESGTMDMEEFEKADYLANLVSMMIGNALAKIDTLLGDVQ